MYSHIPEYDLKAVNDRFTTKAYTPGDGTSIAVVEGNLAQIKAVLRKMRRATKNPNRVSFFDAGRRHPHVVFLDNATRRGK